MNKKTLWVIGLVCLIFSANVFANKNNSLKEIETTYASAPSKSAKKIIHDMLYKNFFFHKAAEACSVETAKFFLDKITNYKEVDEYLMSVRKPYQNITIDPYQQAVISGCLPVVVEIDAKLMQLMSMKLKSRMDPYVNCNSNLHLMILTKDQGETKTELNREMVKYFLDDLVAHRLRNLDDCSPVDVLDLNREKFSNYYIIRNELSSPTSSKRPHLEEWIEVVLDNCRAGYNGFAAANNQILINKSSN